MQKTKRHRIPSPLSKQYFDPIKHHHQNTTALNPIISQDKSKPKVVVNPLKLYKPITNNIKQMTLQYPHALYQGECIRNPEKNSQEYLRHGEGILFHVSGHLIAGKWNYDSLEGECIIFIPCGGYIVCEMINSKMVGWTITIGIEGSIICEEYHLDVSKGKSMIYSSINENWMIHDKNKVETFQMQYGKIPPIFNQKVSDKLFRVFQGNIIPQTWKIIKKIDINKEGCYYIGYTDQHYGHPSGLGTLITMKEMYSGFFEQGLLHNYGRIVYKNGDAYQGGLSFGEPNGKGSYYNLMEDETTQCFFSKKQMETGKSRRGNINEQVISQVIENYFLTNRRMQISSNIRAISDQMMLLLNAYIKHHDADSYKSTGSPQHSVPQLDIQPRSPEVRSSRKLSMPLTLSLKPSKVSQQGKSGIDQRKQMQSQSRSPKDRSPSRIKQEQEDALTFMKRITQDLDKRLSDVPSLQDTGDNSRVLSSKRRHKIFNDKSRLG